jgi:tRNA(fMet)-specific endonuclease VapC
MPYLLDTNTLIYAHKDVGGIRARLQAHAPTEFFITALTVVELEHGIANSSKPHSRRLFLDSVLARYGFLPLDLNSARRAGQIRAGLQRGGKKIGENDVLIAGIALTHGLTVVTRNVNEFERVPGLVVENWYQ